MDNPRIIAFYLPQYFPTPENDKWWGKGFTEWTNVGRAKPLFKGHYQPKVPSELGYYDLRLREVREQQAQLAKEAGIEGFCYWHYWFNGQRLLDRVFNEVVESGSPNFPFCLCWANHSWYKKTWDPNQPNIMLMEQTYPGIEDYTNHFNSLLSAFRDKRYIKVDGKPVFGLYKAVDLPDIDLFVDTWNNLAKQNGFSGMYFFGFTYEESQQKTIMNSKLDSVVFDYMYSALRSIEKNKLFKVRRKIREFFGLPNYILYTRYTDYVNKLFFADKRLHPCVIPNFDHSPRSGAKNIIIHDAKPKLFGEMCANVIGKVRKRKGEDNFLFIKSWNEWGEGNYMEPDLKYGRGYIDELRQATK